MIELLLQWMNDPAGALYELFNRSVFYVALGIVTFLAGSIWGKIKYRAKSTFYTLRKQTLTYTNDTFEGLIFTVGLDPALQRAIIHSVNPTCVGLIFGDDEAGLIRNGAEEFRKELESRDIRVKIYHENDLDVELIEKDCESLLAWMRKLGLRDEKIAVDLTGGKTPLSIAAYHFAVRHTITAIYTDSRYENRKPVPGTQTSIILSGIQQ